MTKAELNRLKYRTISFKDIITGGWAHRFQADLNFRLGPTLVGPTSPSGARTSVIESVVESMKWTLVGLF